jgi:uncharacterized protein (TIGR00730 family)
MSLAREEDNAPAGGVIRRRRASRSVDPELDEHLRAIVKELPPADAEIALEIVGTALKLAREQVTRLDRKIVNRALKEMRRAFRVFAPYKGIRKVTIFGSARIEKGDPEYDLAREFSREIAGRGWMVITGAGPGIMEAGHEGAGGELSFGANILLPFEMAPNPVIAEDAKLINFKYFFTRKLTFIKEADAFVLLPGGFGTLDETLELLTLMQTGKSDLHPIVLLEAPGGTYWESFERYLREQVVPRGYIDADDLSLYRRLEDPVEAVREIEKFYRVYHSQRVVQGRLVFRLMRMPDSETLKSLSEEFSDILQGPIESVPPSPAEIEDQDFPELPRISLPFDRVHAGRLRQLVDRLNELPASKSPPQEYCSPSSM